MSDARATTAPASGELRAADGTRLSWRAWPAVDPFARLALLHGAGEHGGRYADLATTLRKGGVSCFAVDHRGHGRSGGPRLHVNAWRRYEEDALLFIERVVARDAALPTFVYGHSMGSLVCLTLALRGEAARIPGFTGWILSGAGVRPSGVARPHLVLIARLLSRILPRLRLDLGIAPEALSHDAEIVRAYREDPLVEGRATVRWGDQALQAVRAATDDAARIADPMLILHGADDPLAEPGGSRWLAETVAGDATLVVYPGALHEPHHESDRADAAGDMLAWMRSRVA